MRNISVKNLLHAFFTNKTNLFIIACLLVLQFVVYFSKYNSPPLSFFPTNENLQVLFYNDSIDSGNSVILSTMQKDSLLQMDFILRKGFVRPYAGISLSLNNNKIFNISKYNQIVLDLETQHVSDLVLYLNTYNDTLKNSSIKHKMLFFCHNVEISGQRSIFKLAFNEFSAPDWWYDINNMSHKQEIKPDWKNVISISIATGLTPDTDIRRQIAVHAITFERNNRQVISWMIILFISALSILFFTQYLRFSNQEVVIKYKPVEVKDNLNSKNNFLDYINQNFHNPDLSLEIISKNTGINQRKISESIASQYGCNVKTYINRIRINESIRLLKESQLNISEIAYKVGFSSPNNFNRVFKYITRKTPSDFQQHKTR
jgi:AraC-like DNA-binding protein